MTIYIGFESMDFVSFWAKDIYYKKIYSILQPNVRYSGAVIIKFVDNTEDEWSFTFNNDLSITSSILDDKPDSSLEHLYYFVRSIINESDSDILDIQFAFTKKEDEEDDEYRDDDE
jgi:hypothetical protein